MDRMDGMSMDLTKDNIENLKKLFPSIVQEGKIDFLALETLLGAEIDNSREKYQLTWAGKTNSIKLAQQPSSSTLRPCKEKSKNWETTENIYVEGDNLEVLKLLQKTYFGAIDVIYIDPPYNTGTNLIYKNDFSSTVDDYLISSGQSDEFGNRYVSNPTTSGRFHSDWLSMMYSRLLLARNLLTKRGIIAIAMDESEIGTLRIMCNEIFGEDNVLGTIVTKCTPQGRGSKNLDPVHEYHILCCKSLENLEDLTIKRNDTGEVTYRSLMRTGTNSRKIERPYRFYPIVVKNGKIEMISDEEYEGIYSKNKKFDEEYIRQLTKKYENEGYTVIYPIAKNGEEKVWQRQFSRVKNEYKDYIFENNTVKIPVVDKKTPFSLWAEDKHSNVEYGTNLVKKLFDGKKVFDYSKSIYTVKDIVSMVSDRGIVLDFFSGSATTAHAVMQLNSEEEANTKFIMVQLPEKVTEDNEAFKLGYSTICDIGEERIRRAGVQVARDWEDARNREGLLNETGEFNVDTGFKVFKLDTTNINPWENTKEQDEESLLSLAAVFKLDRDKEDILYEIMLKYGVFDRPVTEIAVNGKTLYQVGLRHMVVCLEDQIDDADIQYICELRPKVVVFNESGFKDDNAKINSEYNLKKAGVEDVKCI